MATEALLPNEVTLGEGCARVQIEERRVAMACAVLLAAGSLTGLVWLGFDLRSAVGLTNVPARRFKQPGAIELLVLAAAVAGPVLLWWRAKRAPPAPVERRRARGAVVAFVTVALLCGLSTHSRFRWVLVEATKARADPYSYVRSIAYWESDNMQAPSNAPTPRIFALGSSQINFAVDEARLARSLPGFDVRKRALPAFGPMQYRAAAQSLGVRAGDVVLCWLSEFDMFREDRVPTNRLRAQTTPTALASLIGSLQPNQVLDNRGEIADLSFAAIAGPWRDRDLWRTVAVKLFWPAPAATADAGMLVSGNDGAQAENLRRAVRRTALVPPNFRSFRSFARYVKEHDARVVVFEGSSRPDALPTDGSFRAETRERLQRMAADRQIEYVPANELPVFAVSDFRDVYHLNAAAQRRFTDYVARRMAARESGP